MTFTPIDVNNLPASDAKLTQLQRSWADSLTEIEKDAVSNYKAELGEPINAMLRGEKPHSNRLAACADALRNALNRAKAPADLILFRGISEREARIYQRFDRNAVFPASCFVSTSIERRTAQAFAEADGQGQVIEITVRRGHKGVAYVHPFPTIAEMEYEVLLNKGISLRLLSADDGLIRLEVDDDYDD